MKRGIIPIGLLFLFTFLWTGDSTISAATYLPNLVKAPNNLNLLIYFPLNENTGTIATDYSGNGNAGTLANGVTWVTGRLSRAVSFDGSDDVITAGTTDVITENGATTINAWIYPTSTGENGEGNIVSQAGSTNGPFLSLSGTNRVRFQVDGATDLVKETSDNTVTLNKWNNIVLTWDGSTSASNVHIYVNGVEASYSTSQDGASMTDNSGQTFRVGNGPGGTRTFEGSIDEVRIYGRVLAQSEALKLFQAKAVVRKGASNLGLAAYWPMNEGQGSVLGDVSGNNNVGTMAGFAVPGVNDSGWGTGRVGKALIFDANNDRIDVTDSSSLSFTNTTTMAVWVKIRSFGGIGDNYIRQIFSDEIGCGGNGASAIWRIGSQGSSALAARIGINFRNGAGIDNDIENNTDLPLNKWTHVAVTTDGSNARFYINGVLDTTVSYNKVPLTNTCNWRIGRGNAIRPFSGTMDDLRLYHRALTATEIFNIYKSNSTVVNQTQTNIVPNGLIAYFPFDGKYMDWSGPTALDASGREREGTLTNMIQSIATAIGKAGQALKFDGSDDSVDITDNETFDLESSGTYTWAMWIRPAVFGDLKNILAEYTTGGTDALLISAHTTADTTFGPVTKGVSASWFTSSGTDFISVHSDDNVLDTDAWKHVTVTYDGTIGTQGDRFKIYVDGVDQTDTGDIFSSGTIANILPDTIQIGGESGAHITGSIDEVRFYNRVLSKREIMNLFCNCRDTGNE